MNSKVLASVLVAALALSACQKKDETADGVDTNGNCTAEFVQAYNEVVFDTQKLAEAYVAPLIDNQEVKKRASTLNMSAKLFSDEFKNTACTALDFDTREVKDIKKDSLLPNHVAALKVIRPLNAGKPLPSKPTDVMTGAEVLKMIDLRN